MNPISEEINTTEKEEGIDFKEILSNLIKHWHWIALSVIGSLLFTFFYLKFKTPVYKISAKILVKDEKKGGGIAAGAEILGDLGGLLGGKSTVDNEAEILKTRYLMEQTVNSLDLNLTYYEKGTFKSEEISDSPVKFKIVAAKDTIITTNIDFEVLNNNQLSIKTDVLDTVVAFDKPFQITEIGTVIVSKNATLPQAIGLGYIVNIKSVATKASELMEALTVEVRNKQITIIDLSLNHTIPKSGEVILNKLIEKYVESKIKDKNEVADSTVKFIQERLNFIGKELGDLEGNIQGFKQRNNLADMEEQSKLLVQSTSGYVAELAKVETQISILKSLQEYLSDNSKNKRVLPSSLIPVDMVFSSAVEKYNQLTLERARKLIGITEANPSIILIDKEIENARSDIQSNLSTTLDGLIITRNKINAQVKQAESQVREVPQIERSYLNLFRQQQIKNELYIFLMQKSEETAISKTSNISDSKTIDPPRADVKPIGPKKQSIFLLGLVAGLLAPICVIYVLELFNNKIQNKDDIMRLTKVPIVGEISHNDGSDDLVVANKSRSAISEQFRALRTSLSFYFTSKEDKVILITSSMSGEGKSFVAVNLGSVLALSNKKVLLMELDLRKPGLSGKLNVTNNFGFTNYMIDPNLTAEDIVKPLEFDKNLFIVSSGPIPPNPSEMLLSDRTRELFVELKAKFDYIIIDAPPIGIITDAQLMGVYADVCFYLVRQNYTFKDQLTIVEGLNRSKRMKALGIVVNGIKAFKGYGYGYGYGTYGDYN